MTKKIDSTDLKILDLLSKNGRIQNVDLAKELRIAPSATLNRMKRLEKEGYIHQYTAKLNEEALGYGFLTFVFIRTNGKSTSKEIGKELSKISAVLEVHQTAGDYCFLIKVRTSGTRDLANLLNDKISKIIGIEGTSTIIALSTFKETLHLNLDANR